ncbi:MAG TPA: hypothetical protein VGX25_13480 [Actinophytocola sp.]|uniref:hypothetical protein n=1 Tax=Actinophytocola sp. TaxID=1872138 RepID=UPI002DDD96A7|nr:hypothetical protein [Actinophytocola sp.]HEV2780395.1 hypothetical protein [Actinophytocola sp.]
MTRICPVPAKLVMEDAPEHTASRRLATLQVTIALRELFLRFPHIELAKPREGIPWRRSAFVRAAYRLPVRIRLR